MLTNFRRPRTERMRGGGAYVEQRTNSWAALVGFLLGRGYSAPAIAEALADGTSDATVRKMAQRWGLPAWGRKADGFIVIPMKLRDRATIASRAAQEGLGQEEYCRQFLVAGARERGTFRSVVKEGLDL
ncbi:hypothetical protein [Devosia sp. 919]|uniref:hypothetical protein n=1 Tax=Devosia sp. 919 TaxID=2726065 RepID=UPI0015574744|nr:hypothetical protein [Devosia sp. 919]